MFYVARTTCMEILQYDRLCHFLSLKMAVCKVSIMNAISLVFILIFMFLFKEPHVAKKVSRIEEQSFGMIKTLKRREPNLLPNSRSHWSHRLFEVGWPVPFPTAFISPVFPPDPHSLLGGQGASVQPLDLGGSRTVVFGTVGKRSNR